jgi:hypothetical protein
MVLDRQDCLVAPTRQFHNDVATIRTVFQGVGQEIGHDALQAFGIPRPKQVLDLNVEQNPRRLGPMLMLRHDRTDEFDQVGALDLQFQRSPDLDTAHVAQLVDLCRQARGAVLDGLQHLRELWSSRRLSAVEASSQDLHVPVQCCQWMSQIVGRQPR